MKHSLKIILILVMLFLVTQYFGLFIIDSYSTETIQNINGENITNTTWLALPFNIERPTVQQETSSIALLISIFLITFLILLIIKYNLEIVWKTWFFTSVLFCLLIAFGSFLTAQLSFILASVLSYAKIFKRNIITQNISELFIYGGLASIFVPVMNILSVSIFLILISIYDYIAVFKTKHMIKMAKSQAKLKIFPGILIPYKKNKAAILGGGDLGLPLIFTGVALKTLGNTAYIIPIFSTLALYCLMAIGKKNKFYPAMPFLSIGCFAGYLFALLL